MRSTRLPVRGGSPSPRRALIRRASSGVSGLRLVAGAVMLACAVALYAATTSPAFGVTEVAVEGAVYTDPAAVRAAALGASRSAENAFRFDAAAAARRIEAFPSVRRVTVRVLLPGRLVVTVSEPQAVLAWAAAGGRFLVDDDGTLFTALAADEPGATQPTVSDQRRSAVLLRVGDRLSPTDLAVARQLAALQPAALGSQAEALLLRVDDTDGFVMTTAPASWTAVFGTYVGGARTPESVPRQVQCLRSLLADQNGRLRRVVLAPEGGSCGTFTIP